MKPLDQLIVPSTGCPAGVGEHHVGRQLAATRCPGRRRASFPSSAGRSIAGEPAVEEADRHLVAVVPGVHRADHADVVDDPGRLGQQLGDLGAALAVLGELPGAAEELLARPVDEAEDDVAAVLGAVVRVDSSGLGSSRSTCDGPPCMNSEIIAFAFGAKCGGRALRSSGRFSPGFFGDVGEQPVLAQQVGQGDRADAEGGVRQERRGGSERAGSVHIEELVGSEELLAEVGQARRARDRRTGRRASSCWAANARAQAASSAVIGRW